MDENRGDISFSTIKKLSGNRICDMNYLIRQVITASQHGDLDCGWKDMEFIKEVRDGLKSTFKFSCRKCHLDFDLNTDEIVKDQMDINILITMGSCKAGAQYSTVGTILKAANIPFMSRSKFRVSEAKFVERLLSAENEPADIVSPKENLFVELEKGHPTGSVEIEEAVARCGKDVAVTDDPVEHSGGNAAECLSKNENTDSSTCDPDGPEGANYPRYCVYCDEKYVQLITHMFAKHTDEKEVKELFSLQKTQDPKYSVWSRALSEKGDSLHDSSSRYFFPRQSKNRSTRICPFCSLRYPVRDFPRHTFGCPFSKLKDSVISLSDLMKINSEDQHSKLVNFKEEIVSKLSNQDVRDIVSRDPVLTGYGIEVMDLELKKGACADLQRLRDILDGVVSSFSLMAKKSMDVVNIVDVFDISQWDTFTEAVHEYASENSVECSPSTIDMLGHHFSDIATFVISKCAEFSLDNDRFKSWMTFLKTNYMNPEQQTWEVLTNRLVHFNRRVNDEICCLTEALTEDCTDPFVFQALNEAVVMKIASFNRKRLARIDNMLISEFNQRIPFSSRDDIWSMLSESEKIMFVRYEYVDICSRFGRTEPILIEEDDVDSIELILSRRRKFGVSDGNLYVFGKEGSKTFEQSSVINEFMTRHHHIRSLFTSSDEMRLYVSSVAQAMSMHPDDESELKKLLGIDEHDGTVDETLNKVLHVARISRLICALNQGRTEGFKGFKLCDVSISAEVASELRPVPTTSLVAASVLDTILNAQPGDRTLSFNSSIASEAGEVSQFESKSHCTRVKRPNPERFDSEATFELSPSSPPAPKMIRRVAWSSEEKRSLEEFFGPDIFTFQKLPSYSRCENAINCYPCLKHRTKAQVKAFINNQQRKMKRTNEQCI